jgi:hypothetical protein
MAETVQEFVDEHGSPKKKAAKPVESAVASPSPLQPSKSKLVLKKTLLPPRPTRKYPKPRTETNF